MAALEQSQIAHFLLSLRFVNPRAVIGGDLVITDVSRRNTVFLATTATGPAFVVKQAVDGTAPGLAREAAALRSLAGLDGLVPELVHHDPAAGVLVLRSPGAGVAWGERSRRARLALGPARALGRALARVHAVPGTGRAAPAERAWGTTLPEPDHERVRSLSTGALDVLARIQANQELCEHLHRVRGELRDDAFTHGDLRWDNCLALGGRRVLLIDWEQAGMGDRAADLGALLADYLRLWIESVPVADPKASARLAQHARHPLDRVTPAMDALWSGYQGAANERVDRRRVAELTAVRLVETAVEHAQGAHDATAPILHMLQVAGHLLRAPEATSWSLLGLRG